MTALVFTVQPDQICMAMDTLVVAAADRLPLAFQRKFVTVPETQLVVAGTGRADFVHAWFEHVQSLLPSPSIDDLDLVAPDLLRDTATAAGGLDGLTTTLYHFGFSARHGRYVGYAYRLVHGFRSEPLPDALGIKPPVPVVSTDAIRFPEFMIDILIRQQAQDRALPQLQQVGIGGEIDFVEMARGEVQVQTVHRFGSYESEQRHIESRSIV